MRVKEDKRTHRWIKILKINTVLSLELGLGIEKLSLIG